MFTKYLTAFKRLKKRFSRAIDLLVSFLLVGAVLFGMVLNFIVAWEVSLWYFVAFAFFPLSMLWLIYKPSRILLRWANGDRDAIKIFSNDNFKTGVLSPRFYALIACFVLWRTTVNSFPLDLASVWFHLAGPSLIYFCYYAFIDKAIQNIGRLIKLEFEEAVDNN